MITTKAAAITGNYGENSPSMQCVYQKAFYITNKPTKSCCCETECDLSGYFLPGNVGAELSYILPDDKVSAFPAMFAELEESKDQLGILGFGASVTTMEEVFIK